jgi:hypothetical protein
MCRASTVVAVYAGRPVNERAAYCRYLERTVCAAICCTNSTALEVHAIEILNDEERFVVIAN